MYVSTTFHGILDKLHTLQLYSHHEEHVGYKAFKAYLFLRRIMVLCTDGRRADQTKRKLDFLTSLGVRPHIHIMQHNE